MTVALNLAMRFERIERDGRGFYDYDALCAFRETCEHLAIESKELCPQSYDSSVEYRFKDGSVLELANPRQAAFSSGISPYTLTVEAQRRIADQA